MNSCPEQWHVQTEVPSSGEKKFFRTPMLREQDGHWNVSGSGNSHTPAHS